MELFLFHFVSFCFKNDFTCKNILYLLEICYWNRNKFNHGTIWNYLELFCFTAFQTFFHVFLFFKKGKFFTITHFFTHFQKRDHYGNKCFFVHFFLESTFRFLILDIYKCPKTIYLLENLKIFVTENREFKRLGSSYHIW